MADARADVQQYIRTCDTCERVSRARAVQCVHEYTVEVGQVHETLSSVDTIDCRHQIVHLCALV